MDSNSFALLAIIPMRVDSFPSGMLSLIAWVLLLSALMTFINIKFLKYKRPRFLWRLGENLRIELIKRDLERAYSAEDSEKIMNLLIEASLQKVESIDYHKQKIGLAELYFHSKRADPRINEKIYRSLIRIFESNPDVIAREEIIKAICYYKHLNKPSGA